MNINERIKYFRKDVLALSQAEFAEKLGLQQRSISRIEQAGSTVTDQVVKTLCLTFNLSESWLRNGTEPMYQPKGITLDEYAKRCNASELEIRIFKAFLSLPKEVREMGIEKLKHAFLESEKPMTTEEAEEIYRKSLSSVRKTESSTLNTTADTQSTKTG